MASQLQRTAPPPKDDAEYLWWALGVGLVAAAGYGIYRLREKNMTDSGPNSEVILLENLSHAPFPAQAGPGAAVVIPPGFSASRGMRVCVYIRGFSNCVGRIVDDHDGPCRPGGDKHNSSHLARQLAASGSQTLLILPELVREARSGDPGQLSRPGSFQAMVEEVLARVAERIGLWTLADIGHLGLMSHSGGYQAMAAIVRQRPAALRSVALLDSLYGNRSDFAEWVGDHARGFSPDGGYRIADIYTDGGGTAAQSRSLAASTQTTLTNVGLRDRCIIDESTTRTLSQAELAGHAAVFKHSGLSHTDVSRYYPQQLWAAGW